MSDVTLSYKGSDILELSDSGSATLKTGDTYCEADIEVEYVKPSGGGGSYNVQEASGSITMASTEQSISVSGLSFTPTSFSVCHVPNNVNCTWGGGRAGKLAYNGRTNTGGTANQIGSVNPLVSVADLVNVDGEADTATLGQSNYALIRENGFSLWMFGSNMTFAFMQGETYQWKAWRVSSV